MLRIFREGGPMKAVMGAVVVLIIAAFTFTFQGTPTSSGDECVATVEDSCISPKDYNLLIRLVAPAGATTTELRKSGLMGYAVEALIERELLLREARRLGLSISDDALDDHLVLGRVHHSWPVDAPVPRAAAQGMPFPVTGASDTVTLIRVTNTQTGVFDYDIYRRQVQNLLRMSPREFKSQQRNELIAARLRKLVTAPVTIANDEAYLLYDQQKSTVSVRFVDAGHSWFERFAVQLTDEEIEQFLESNRAEVDAQWEQAKDNWQAGCPLVSELLFPYPPDADADDRAEQAVRAQRAQDLLRQRVEFGDVARFISEGQYAAQGGDLGCLTEEYGAGAETLLEVAEQLRPGAVSDVVETPRGLHLLQLHGSLAADEVEQRGRQHLARRLALSAKAKQRAQEFGQQLIEKTTKDETLHDSLDALLPEVVAFPPVAGESLRAQLLQIATEAEQAPKADISREVNRAGTPVAGLKDRSVVGELFGLEVGAVLPKVLETFRGIAVLQLRDKDLATPEEFEEDRGEVVRALEEQKRNEVLSSYVRRLRERAKRVNINPKYAGTAPAEDETPEAGQGSG